MLYHQIGTSEVIDTRRSLRIVHRIGHVSHQGHVFTELDHLADRKRATEDAHIEVHTT